MHCMQLYHKLIEHTHMHTLGENGDLAYRVLWLPPRYPFFIAYIIHVVLFVCATFVKLTLKRKYLY